MTSHTSVSPDDIRIGLRIPSLETTPTIEDLVRWSAAADDYTAFHFDAEAAGARGFAGPVVHGTYQASLIARMLNEWLGPSGTLSDLACRYRRPAIVGIPLVCGAEITAIDEEDDGRVVSFDVWAHSPAGEIVTTGTATARIPTSKIFTTLISEELLAVFKIGEVVGTYTFEVTPEHIRSFAGVLNDVDLEASLVHDPGADPAPKAPTTFFSALDPLELKLMPMDLGLDAVGFHRTGGGNAFNEVEYDRPIRAGDVITVEVSYTDVYERRGRSGPLLFRVRENVLTDANGQRIAVCRSGHVYAFEVPGYQPPERSSRAEKAAETEIGELLPPLTRTPTTATLVRYSAAANDYAPLHFDHNYAKTRGYDGVIVHGFLKAGYLGTVLENWAGSGAFVKRFRAEYRGPDFPDRPITCRGRVTR
jgi:acyl dehydratase